MKPNSSTYYQKGEYDNHHRLPQVGDIVELSPRGNDDLKGNVILNWKRFRVGKVVRLSEKSDGTTLITLTQEDGSQIPKLNGCWYKADRFLYCGLKKDPVKENAMNYLTTYHTGEYPQIGDAVRVHITTEISDFSPLRCTNNQNLIVVDVKNGIRSTLLKLSAEQAASMKEWHRSEIESRWYMTSHFKLVDSSNLRPVDSTPKLPEFHIFDDKMKLLTSVTGASDLEDQVHKILRQKPYLKLHVYRYDRTNEAEVTITNKYQATRKNLSLDGYFYTKA